MTERPYKMPWDDYYMNICREIARRSSCIKRQIGSLIVIDNKIISTGYNGTPRGVTDCAEGGCARCSNKAIVSGTQLDTCWCNHAEENAILNAAYHGSATKGGRLYTTFSPCLTCAKMIVNAGIIEVVYWSDYPQQSALLLTEAGVHFRQLRYHVDRHARRAVGFKFTIESIKELDMLTINTIQKAKVSITPVDRKGHPARVDGIPVWSLSNEGPVSLFPADDGLSCDVVGLAVGTCQLNVTGDADLGSGVVNITGALDVEVTAAQAVGFTINVGTVEDQA